MMWPTSFITSKILHYLSRVYVSLDCQIIKVGFVRCGLAALLLGVGFRLFGVPSEVPFLLILGFGFILMADDMVRKPERFRIFAFSIPEEREVKQSMRVLFVGVAPMLGYLIAAVARVYWPVEKGIG